MFQDLYAYVYFRYQPNNKPKSLHPVYTNVYTKIASIKVILYTKKTYSDGSHPIIFQIIDNRKVLKKVIYNCIPKYWDLSQSRLKSAAPNAFEINKLINAKLSFYEKAILLAKEEDREISSKIFDENTMVLGRRKYSI